ncbi:MAG TPA: penicillin-binding transpeptidase domain-containing protein, partial [Syntrophomonadaceae bacterium]|nr:penicillin-binding transpeptidase domain-containing protein [Syntrophomonadaceae bacterium]
YSKEAILNMYLNEIYIGRGCSGMQCAALTYFGKDVMNLSAGEITTLAGMIQAPEYYRPDDNMERVKKRQTIVVNNLVSQAYINAEEGEEMLKESINVLPYKPAHTTKHPYYISYLTALLEDIVGAQKLYQGGLKIYTTIDPQMQLAAEKALHNNVASFTYRGIKAQDAALVSLNPGTGEIKAMVGGDDFEKNQLNMAVIARQPGSAIKPLIYAAAINEGLINDNTTLNNKERNFNNYQPKNFGTDSPNTTTVREAIVRSHNIAAVELLEMLKMDKAIKYLQSLGITSITDDDKNLALALGGMSKGISPLQMAAAYATFPSKGIFKEHFTIQKIVDERGKNLFGPRLNEKRVFKNKTTEAMDSILKDVVSYGTGTPARVSIASGGKTGTTTDSRDLWYVGYTSELVTAVWVGNSDGKPVTGYGSYGGTVAGPIWRDYMNNLIYNRLLKEAPPPPPPAPVEEEEDDEYESEEEEEGELTDELEEEEIDLIPDEDDIMLTPPISEIPEEDPETDDSVLPEEVPLIIE